MPIVNTSTYHPPFFLRNGHLQTILGKIRKVKGIEYKRERMILADGDFFDLDWSYAGKNSKKIAIILHGLESSAYSNNVLNFVEGFNKRNWDSVSINLRGCSGEANNFFSSYNAGSQEEIDATVKHVLKKSYDEITLLGYSLGGSMCIRYLAAHAHELDKRIKRTAHISVPCDLGASARKISGTYYFNYYRNKFYKKYKEKFTRWPDIISLEKIEKIKGITSFEVFDTEYTAPLYGYRDADHYWRETSCLQMFPKINIPLLIINAKDDPVLTGDCFPYEQVKDNPYIFLETPESGGHCGFVTLRGEFWHINRAISFIENKE
ncbi:MAG: alpha/beta fold hydrolase [Spirochaetales bacterium]|nr:alpha/beta fold hydrolase [Spirochaetales bacterium]